MNQLQQKSSHKPQVIQTTTSDLCQLRSHIKALQQMINSTAKQVPKNITIQFDHIDQLFHQLLSCDNFSSVNGDYPVHPDFLEKSEGDKLHQIACEFIVSLINRGDKMMLTVTEEDKSISPYMRLITKMLQGIGFELLHYVKVLEQKKL